MARRALLRRLVASCRGARRIAHDLTRRRVQRSPDANCDPIPAPHGALPQVKPARGAARYDHGASCTPFKNRASGFGQGRR